LGDDLVYFNILHLICSNLVGYGLYQRMLSTSGWQCSSWCGPEQRRLLGHPSRPDS